mgnify:CR=1 FL=1
MEMHIFGVLYTVLFVILCCDVYRGLFQKKRDLSGKWCRYAVIGAMILADYFISVKLDGDIILKEIAIIVTGTLFMCLCFRQRWIKQQSLFCYIRDLFCDGLYFYYNAV